MKEYISPHQLICLIIGFLLGTAIILSPGISFGKRDTWISELIAGILGLIIFLMVSYISKKFDYDNIYDLMKFLVGKILSKVMLVYFLFISFFLALLVINNISTFMSVMILNTTPPSVFAVTISLSVAVILKKGFEVATRCAEFLIPIIIVIMLFLLILVFAQPFHLYNLLPIFSTDLRNILKAAIPIAAFPYTECVLFIFIIPLVRKKQNIYKDAVKGVLISMFFLTLIPILSIGVFGVSQASALVYPIFSTIRAINFNEYFTRVELLVISIWLITSFIKLFICMYISASSIQYIFLLKDYKDIVVPQSILMIPLSLITYLNYREVLPFVNISWPFLCMFIFVNLIILFIAALYKKPLSHKIN